MASAVNVFAPYTPIVTYHFTLVASQREHITAGAIDMIVISVFSYLVASTVCLFYDSVSNL